MLGNLFGCPQGSDAYSQSSTGQVKLGAVKQVRRLFLTSVEVQRHRNFSNFASQFLEKYSVIINVLYFCVKIPKPPETRSESQFVGLDNQGATCYLNSLIQAMYMTPELRFGLFNVDPKELGVYSLDEYLEEKSNAVTLGIVEADDSQLEQLKEFGIEEEIARRALIIVKNAGIMEAMDYIEQHENELRAQISKSLAEDSKKKKKKPRLIPLELQRLFTQMQLLNRRSLSTQGTELQHVPRTVQYIAPLICNCYDVQYDTEVTLIFLIADILIQSSIY
jgi:Ubiquitin carboxyl-terminal hydrolase